jgi:hypothetical protein
MTSQQQEEKQHLMSGMPLHLKRGKRASTKGKATMVWLNITTFSRLLNRAAVFRIHHILVRIRIRGF